MDWNALINWINGFFMLDNQFRLLFGKSMLIQRVDAPIENDM